MAAATLEPARTRRADTNLSRVPYLPGLDGMRALAVIAVMVYHANNSWLAGGFLGVEVFFVISGYLITLLLISERESTGTVRLGAFWMRRARRLLPALFVMMFLLLTYTAVFKADVLGKLRGDLFGGLFYVSNWYQIWVGQGYSASGDFDSLRHLLFGGDLRVVDFDGGLYAVTRFKDLNQIGKVWKQLVVWREGSRYQAAHHQWLEELLG